jgi:hypothetical protein
MSQRHLLRMLHLIDYREAAIELAAPMVIRTYLRTHLDFIRLLSSICFPRRPPFFFRGKRSLLN